MNDKDIYLSAIDLIQQHGEQAWTEATLRYFKKKEEGDQEGMILWRSIGRAINTLNETISPGPLN